MIVLQIFDCSCEFSKQATIYLWNITSFKSHLNLSYFIKYWNIIIRTADFKRVSRIREFKLAFKSVLHVISNNYLYLCFCVFVLEMVYKKKIQDDDSKFRCVKCALGSIIKESYREKVIRKISEMSIQATWISFLASMLFIFKVSKYDAFSIYSCVFYSAIHFT